MSRIKLTVDGEERNVLFFSTDYFHPDPLDRVWVPRELLELYKRFGTVDADYEQPYFRTLKDFDRHSPRAYRAHGQPFGGLFCIVMESTGSDDLFYHWFKTTRATHGMLEFYNSKDEDLPFRRLEFWDGWISELSETMASAGSIPMLLCCEISPATVRYNKSLVFQKNWFITDINQKQVKTETEEPLQVLSIKGNTEVVIGSKVDYSVEKLNREATKKEKSQINWAMEINNDKIEYLKDTGDKIGIHMKEEWRGFNIKVHAYTEDIDDAATLEAITIKYFKKNPKISGLTSQPDTTTCVITVMEYVSKAVKGTAYSFDYYLNLYMNTYLNLEALNPLEKLRAVNAFAKDSGIDLNNMEAFINKCFETVPDRNTVQNINNGYPVICGIRRGVENGHCLAIIGYTSDKRIVIIDPERTEKVIVNVNDYLFYKSIRRNKTIE